MGLNSLAWPEDHDEMEVDEKHHEQVQQQAVLTFRLVLKSKMIDPPTLSLTAETIAATSMSAFRESGMLV